LAAQNFQLECSSLISRLSSAGTTPPEAVCIPLAADSKGAEDRTHEVRRSGRVRRPTGNSESRPSYGAHLDTTLPDLGLPSCTEETVLTGSKKRRLEESSSSPVRSLRPRRVSVQQPSPQKGGSSIYNEASPVRALRPRHATVLQNQPTSNGNSGKKRRLEKVEAPAQAAPPRRSRRVVPAPSSSSSASPSESEVSVAKSEESEGSDASSAVDTSESNSTKPQIRTRTQRESVRVKGASLATAVSVESRPRRSTRGDEEVHSSSETKDTSHRTRSSRGRKMKVVNYQDGPSDFDDSN
jgi:hypothetical protein